MVKINEYPVKENEAAIVLDERKDGWNKLAKLRSLLKDRYNFYIETDGVGNIFIHLADINCDEMGSERYKWVSAEEDDFLEGNREEEQEQQKKDDYEEAKATAYCPEPDREAEAYEQSLSR